MTAADDRRDEDREHLDAERCCECGDTDHVCQDCPTFIGDVIDVGALASSDEDLTLRRAPST